MPQLDKAEERAVIGIADAQGAADGQFTRAQIEDRFVQDPLVLDGLRRRPRYFDGRFLTGADLTRDQDYARQRQAEPDVGLLQRGAPCAQHVDRLIRRRLMVREQLFSLLQLAEDGFHHAIVQQRGELVPLGFDQLRRLDVERQTALQPQHLLQTAVVGDVGGFGRPGGNGARARRDQQQPAFGGVFGERRTVLEQALKFGVFFGT